jgi:SSS family transporter
MGFGLWDYAAMLLYLMAVVGFGVFFMHRQKDTKDYFLGGRRMHWLPIAISLFASIFSPISFVSTPGEGFNHGMMLFTKSVFVLLGVPPAIYLFVRFYRRLSLTTAYEYLERRFDLRIRLLTSFIFLMLRSFYLGVVLYASAVVLKPTTGLDVWVSIVLMSIIATLYTTFGGIKSVIWIEVMQFFIFVGGILLVIGVVVVQYGGGVGEIWSYARQHNHTFGQLASPEFYSLDPFLRVSLLGALVSSVFTKLTLAGADQVSIQRYLSTRNENDAARSLIWGTIVGIPVMFLLFFTGLALYWFYGVYPDRGFEGMAGDQALPHFLAHHLPPGFGGLMTAAILSAAMSTVESGLNSLSTCTVTDFYARLVRPQASDAQKLRLAKICTVFWGLIATLSAGAIVWLYGTQNRNNPLVTISEVTLGFFGGILLGVFFLGILSRRATPRGVLVGVAAGFFAALAVTAPYYFRELPPGQKPLSFFWINIIGCLATTGVGYFASLLSPPPPQTKIDGLTYWNSGG